MSGYKVLSLNHENFTVDGDAIKVPGIHNAIAGNTKPTLLCDFKLGTVNKTARYVVFGQHGSEMVAEAGFDPDFNALFVHVSNDDMVSFKENE